MKKIKIKNQQGKMVWGYKYIAQNLQALHKLGQKPFTQHISKLTEDSDGLDATFRAKQACMLAQIL